MYIRSGRGAAWVGAAASSFKKAAVNFCRNCEMHCVRLMHSKLLNAKSLSSLSIGARADKDQRSHGWCNLRHL